MALNDPLLHVKISSVVAVFSAVSLCLLRVHLTLPAIHRRLLQVDLCEFLPLLLLVLAGRRGLINI
jgi:riboflavin transporter FmnP